MYVDHRLSKILSDIRLDQAESIRRKRLIQKRNHRRIRLNVIAGGENARDRDPKAA